MNLASTPAGIALATFVVRVLSPSLVFLSAFSLFFTKPPSPPSSSSPITPVVVASRVPRRAWILSLLSLSALTYLFDGLSFLIYAIIQQKWYHPAGMEINAVVGVAAFTGLAALGSWKDIHGVDVWLLKRVKAVIAVTLALDIALSVLIGLYIRDFTEADPPFSVPIRLLLQLVFPLFRVLVLLPLLATLLSPRIVFSSVNPDGDYEEPVPSESSFLLPPGSNASPSAGLLAVPGLNGDPTKYGTFRHSRSMLQRSNPTTRAPTPTPSHSAAKQDDKVEIALEPSWSEIWHRLQRLSPYLWPSKSKSLQLLALVCIIILLIGRVVNAAMPFALGELIRIFEHRSNRSPWLVLGGYVALRFLQGSGGLNALRDALWAPVMQYSDREMSQLSFNHLLNLSFAFHTRRKTGEILRVLDRGAAINHTLELLLFNILPTFIDIAVALVIFCITFEWTLALVLFFVMFAYVSASVVLTQWRTRIRREMNERDIITRGIHTDCLLNYETVKYFGGEEHEANRYSDALNQYQVLEYRVIMSLNLLNLIQNFIITLGLLVGSIIVARRVIATGAGASEFVIFITYLGQLYAPLNQLGYIYRSVNQSLVDTEKLLKLLNEPTDINDKPNAPDLIIEDGEIEFDNVSFSYDGRTTALNGVSFKVPKNSSVALVGESGSGKSTILRLLYRFYDLGEGQGRILIDGKDIRDVTQKSLRQAIGVVPQDSVLFNTSIKYNIGYGKFGASDDEIEAAARSAQMHDRIMSFPQGYETVVGERGVRLSGGEKQRVAIARTLLKNPPILLLDEATSALDTSTEKDIQKALQNLITGRSSLSIAHRLSTIASADVILVLKDGQIAEQGSHRELLARDGIFASMWADQVSATEDAPISIRSIKPEPSAYSAEPTEHVPGHTADLTEEPSVIEATQTSADPADASVVFGHATEPSSGKLEFPSNSAAIAFPNSEPDQTSIRPPSVAIPLAFPTSDDAPATSEYPQPQSPQSPGVTFDAGATTPARSGTPDPEGETKRKRLGSQNFQRLARRISITTRRQGSVASMIPGLRKDKDKEQTPRGSTDDGTSGSLRGETSRNSNDSPTASVSGVGDTDKGKKKKEKKDKKRKSIIP